MSTYILMLFFVTVCATVVAGEGLPDAAKPPSVGGQIKAEKDEQQDYVCADKYDDCKKMKAEGECEISPSAMRKVCSETCGFCSQDGCEQEEYFLDLCPKHCKSCGIKNSGGCKSHHWVKSQDMAGIPQAHYFIAGHGAKIAAEPYGLFHACRIYVNNRVESGFARFLHGKDWDCYANYDGKSSFNYTGTEILVNPERDNLRWVKSGFQTIPKGTVNASKIDGLDIIVTRCRRSSGDLVSGNMRSNAPDVAWYNFYEKEYACHEFEVLTCTEKVAECDWNAIEMLLQEISELKASVLALQQTAVTDMRLWNREEVGIWYGPGISDNDGFVITSVTNWNKDDFVDHVSRRQVYKFANRTWSSVGP